MARYTGKTTWPHGKATELCTTCNGSGMRPGFAEQLQSSKRKLGDLSASSQFSKCQTCEGRGRLLARVQS